MCIHLLLYTRNIEELKKIQAEIELAVKDIALIKSRYSRKLLEKYVIDIENVLKVETDYTNYELKLGEKNLNGLSPGEKGALLLVFYLLLDKSDIPLILDQPEDNLDNHSVANILVPFIKMAKSKRQIIMVTHNPNLAVVADAERITHVNIDKKDENKFSFISGSIENKEINKSIVNVLEGTMPAFNQRKRKYYEIKN